MVRSPVKAPRVARARRGGKAEAQAEGPGAGPGAAARAGQVVPGPYRYGARSSRVAEKGARSTGGACPSTEAATASAVMGQSRMPLRVWPVA
jgi:hypothetical protein